MTKKYSTSQVVRLLELHPDWVFEAPETGRNVALRAKYHHGIMGDFFAFEKRAKSGWATTSLSDNRPNWARVSPPAKAKRERVVVGGVTVNDDNRITRLSLDLSDLKFGEFEIVAVKK